MLTDNEIKLARKTAYLEILNDYLEYKLLFPEAKAETILDELLKALRQKIKEK